MARSFRDRFWSPPVARAVTAPSSILLAGGAAAVGIVATAPLSLPLGVLAGVVVGGLAYGGRVLAAVPRDRSTAGIDPFAVQEPWRRFVQDAISARRRFDEAVRAMDTGPLRDTLADIGDRLDDGLQETWRVARRGDTLMGARARVDSDAIEADLAEAEARLAAAPDDPRAAQVAEAIRSQRASAERMQAVIEDAVSTLRLLDARLDESVTRAIELSTGTGPAAHASAVGGDVEGIVSEMEALRLALDEAGSASGGGPRATPAA